MLLKAIFFDIDGTLVDSNDMHVLAWEESFASLGFHFDRVTIHNQIGKGTDMLVPALIPDVDDETQAALGKAHSTAFKGKFLSQVEPFPGAHDLLARVHGSGRQVVLASSASADELEHYLDLLDARSIVGASTSADDVEHTKPAPDIFATALKKVAPLSADQVIVVGDTPYDIEAAANCRIATVALRSGKFSDYALSRAGAVGLYDNVAALLREFDSSPLAQ